MDIHIVVEKPEYMILSEQAAKAGKQIGHYCTRILRAHLAETKEENQELVALRILVKDLEKTIEDMRTELEGSGIEQEETHGKLPPKKKAA